MRRIALAALAAAALASACAGPEAGPAELWTDVPELALAVELFNASQDRHLVVLRWQPSLAEAIRQAKLPPALAVGRYLKSQELRERFRRLDGLVRELELGREAFYPALLELGNIEGRQLLLPVSFNLPAIVFARGAARVGDDFVLGMADMAPAAAAYNRKEGGAYSRMGFSPRWDPGFLALLVSAEGAGFREGKPLAWDEGGLAAGLAAASSWVSSTNGPAEEEDEFQFKYLYTPAYQYAASGRTLFACVDSSEFFTIPEEKRASLDYRWFAASGGSVPVSEDIVYAAVPRAGKGQRAARAFLAWFFREDSQRALLELSRETRAIDASFGVAGGFSSIRAVNEKVFPLYYSALVGHMPPAGALAAPKVLPSDWPELKAEALGPWLVEATGRKVPPADPGAELAARIAEQRKRAAQR